MRIDRNSFIPIYAQIHQNLRTLIVSGEIGPGDPVPSERQLSEQYGISRMTARHALRALYEDGFVRRAKGLGTFATRHKVEVHTRNLVGFSEEMQRRGLQPSSRLVGLRKEKASASTAEQLRMQPGQKVYHLQRVRLANDSPMAYESSYLPLSLFPGLEKLDLAARSLYQILEQEYGFHLRSAIEVLEAGHPSPLIARYLRVRKTAAVLTIHRVVYTDTDEALESVKTVYRADRYRATFALMKEISNRAERAPGHA